MTIEQKEIILKVLNTLNTVKVEGFENMNKMIGCMQVLQEVLNPKEGELDDSKPTK